MQMHGIETRRRLRGLRPILKEWVASNRTHRSRFRDRPEPQRTLFSPGLAASCPYSPLAALIVAP